MNNLMTLIMNVVRKMTGSDQKMNVSEATKALSTLAGFKVDPNGGDYDLDQLSGNQIVFVNANPVTKDVNVSTTDNHVPTDHYWWTVISIDAGRNDQERKAQFAIPDAVPKLYMRNKEGNANWSDWIKLGGN